MTDEEETFEQEEIRDYDLTRKQARMCLDYIEDLQSRGSALEVSKGIYYISQELHGRGLVLSVYNESIQIVGESSAVGKMASEIRGLLEIKLKASTVEKW